MKIFLRFFLPVALFVAAAGALQAKNKQPKAVYAFAVGTCLNDSVIYMSAITPVDSAVVDKKTMFLNDRMLYSNQFKAFLDNTYAPNHTCAVFFATSKDAAEKKYVKLRRRYNKDQTRRLVEVPVANFKFSAPNVFE